MASTETITFVELTGPGARSGLMAVGRLLADAGRRTELLRSVDQSDLWLLLVRGEPLSYAPLPEGARSWSFTTAEGVK